MNSISRLIVSTAACAAGLLFMSGCLSDSPGSSSIAYVKIASQDAAAVRLQTIRVFCDENYSLVDEEGGALTFEREATQRDRTVYGRYEEPLVMRVVVQIGPSRGAGWILVRADAFAVRPGVTDKVLRIGRRPYQSLLNRVEEESVRK